MLSQSHLRKEKRGGGVGDFILACGHGETNKRKLEIAISCSLFSG